MHLADWLWLFGAIAVCVGALWLAKSIEPHWSAKDGSTFTCRYQHISRRGAEVSSWQEGRAIVEHDRIVIKPKGVMRRRPPTEPMAVVGRSDAAPRHKAVFLLDGGTEVITALRVPASSPAVDRLVRMLPR